MIVSRRCTTDSGASRIDVDTRPVEIGGSAGLPGLGGLGGVGPLPVSDLMGMRASPESSTSIGVPLVTRTRVPSVTSQSSSEGRPRITVPSTGSAAMREGDVPALSIAQSSMIAAGCTPGKASKPFWEIGAVPATR